MLNVQKFCREHRDWEELLSTSPYYIKIKKNSQGLILFNYTQGASDSFDPIVNECRGLVLDSNFNVVRFGFRRFYNFGEAAAAKIDWENCWATQKLDGTLIFLYYYNGWRIGTRGSFDAIDAVWNNTTYKNFMQLFSAAIVNYPDFSFDILDKNCTYCLELCSPYSRVVVAYDHFMLTHILTRDNTTFEELDVNIGIPKPTRYEFNSLDDYKSLIQQMDNKDNEGIVVQDASNNRVKMKTDTYFQLHYMANNNNFSFERVFNIYREGEESEFIAYFPEYSDWFELVRLRIAAATSILEDIYVDVEYFKSKNLDCSRRKFVEEYKPSRYFHLYMLAYDYKLWDWWLNSNYDTLSKHLPLESIN